MTLPLLASRRSEAPAVASPQRTGRFPWVDASIAAVFACVAMAMVSQALVGGGTLGRYPSDGTRSFYFVREYLLRSLQQGKLPLWNPFTHFGTPFLANMQWGVLYPLNLPLVPLPPDPAYNVFIAMHLAMAGIFMFMLARDWGLSRVPAAIAAFSFMLSGRFLGWASGGTLNILSSAAWLPLVVLVFRRAVFAERDRVVWTALVASVLGLEIVSGHPQFTFFSVLVLFVVAAWRTGEMLADRRGVGPAVRPIVMFAAAICLAIGLGAAQIVPTYEGARNSTRGFEWTATALPRSIEGSYNPLRLLTWLVPDVYGNTVSLRPAATDWLSLALGEPHSDEFRGYIGVLPFLLALFSITRWRDDSSVRLLWVICGSGFVIALGRFTPIYPLMYALVPPLRAFRIPGRYLTLVVFSLALLAGFGADALLHGSRPSARRWIRPLAALATVLLVSAGAAIAFHTPLLAYGQRIAAPLFASRPSGFALAEQDRDRLVAVAYALALRGTLIAAAFAGASAAIFMAAARGARPWILSVFIVAGVTVDLALQASMYTNAEPMHDHLAQNAPLMQALRAAGGGTARGFTLENSSPRARPDLVRPSENAYIHERLFTAGGYDPFELATYHAARDLLEADLRSGSSYIASVFGLRFIVTEIALPAARFNAVGRIGTATIYENLDAVPRFYVAGGGRAVRDSAMAFASLQARRIRPGEEVLLETTEPMRAEVGERAGRAAVISMQPEELRLDVHADRDGYLVVNDSYYPGWTATVDDRAQPILRANGHVRAVHLTAGDHVVIMRFEPPLVRLGAWISIVLTAATIATIAGAMIVRARPQP
jgi:hypothetical protein